METKTSERRYNTRFRGVPRSVFTYSRKKSTAKSNDENHMQNDIRNDFVYTKLGKKPNQKEPTSPPKSKNKVESFNVIKNESIPSESDTKVMQNGTHKSPTESKKEVPPLKIKDVPSIKNKETSHKKKEVLSPKRKDVPPFQSKILIKEKNELSTAEYKKSSSTNDNESDSPENDIKLIEMKQEVPENQKSSVKTEESAEEVSPLVINLSTLKMKDDPSLEYDRNEMGSEPYPNSENELDGDEMIYDPKSLSDELHCTSENGGKSAWITSKEKLSWDKSPVASYNPKTKMFRCVACQAVGFMSRIGEHYLGTHCNAKVFHCPQCSYSSAWWRCVRIHMSKNHGVTNAPASIWKNQPLLDEIMQILQNLKQSVDCEDKVERVAENSGKRYICPKCPYATDRRDLYNRHENIHREEKPFQCYICYKLFNRADHVKKHFCRIHKEFHYDINLIRRLPSKRSKIPVSPLNGLNSVASSNGLINPSVPVTQSQLLNCLIGSPTMVQVKREIDQMPDISKKDPLLHENKNDNTFNKSHSNLLTFLTQNAFSPKPISKPTPVRNTDTPIKDILHDALVKPPGYSSFQSSQPKSYNCAYCPWNGPNAWALRLHTSMHYKTCCVLCNFKSTEASDLENHMWECHKKRSCNKCNFLADSLLALDAHMREVHFLKPQFSCRHCSQSFEVRSDMEAHCIFIHNQVLQECKENGCDFCTTDPEILQVHKKENHSSSSNTQDPSASRTLCLYCGCDFADPQSLSLHEELFHENPLQVAGRRPLNPYGCAVCGYSTPKQPMMMEHMRIHTGQTLRCQAGDGCNFNTPYDTVLREHVLQSHSNDDGVVRCPHCGFRCSTRFSFVTHYKELHHPFCCQLCEEIEHKHFVSPSTTSFLDSSVKTMFPFAKKVSSTATSNVEKSSEENGRRSRKQMQPRKVIVPDSLPNEKKNEKAKTPSRREIRKTSSQLRKREFISLYIKKVRKLAQGSLLKRRICVKSPIYFRHKRNYVLHRQWHCLKKYNCNKCIQTFCHRYQVLLHQREHRKTPYS